MAGPVGSSVGVLTGVAVGGAATVALQPAFEIPRQDAWSRNANKILDVGLLARLVAQGGIDLSSAEDDAKRDGFSADKLDALVYLEQTVPGVSEALRLWRLGLLSEGLFSHVLVKAGLDQRYAAPILNSKHAEVVGLGDIAYGVVRGILPAPAWVPVAPPAQGDKVPRFPQVQIDPLELAHKLGFNEDMLKLEVGRSGLSMAPGMAAQALFRKIIGPNDFLLAIAEGDLRTEWADAVHEVSRQILTAGEYAELQLRGYYDRTTRLENTRKHGMTDADSDLLYDVQGRGLSLHSAFIAERRGGVFRGPTDAIPDWAMFQLQRGNLRPEVYNLAWAGRHTYPSPFVIRGLLTDGAITEAQGEQIYLDVGWPDWLATKVANHYAPKPGAGPSADPHVTKADNQLWTAQHTAYVKDRSDDAFATETLQELGVAATAIPTVLARWQREREIHRAGLSAAQIKKAFGNAAVNAATNAPWTRDEAVAALMDLGFSSTEAASYLNI